MATANKKPTTNTKLADTIERLERRLAQVTEEHQRLHDAVVLAGHMAQVSRWSLTPPPGFDQMPAADRYRWLQAQTPIGISTPTPAGEAAYLRVAREILGPLQQQEQDAQKAVAAARDELAQARNQHDIEHFDEVSADTKAQLKTARAAHKAANDTVASINKQITDGEMDRLDAVAALERLDEQQAQAIANGQSIDDEAHVLAQARVMSIERRLKVTRQAAQTAASKAQEAQQEVKRLEGEGKRLQTVKHQHTTLVKLKALAEELKAAGVPTSTIEEVCRRVAGSSLAAVVGSI